MGYEKCALPKIKKYPNKEIQSVLRFSYDGLDEVEEAAFLDASGFYGASGIHVLQQKALITISSDNIIQMHDLIREMGCKIVLKNLLNVQEDAGTDKVEAMQIDVSQITNLPLEVDTLKRMSPLPFLKFNLPTPAEAELSMSPNPAPFRSPENQDALLSSAGCKELMSIANEIHIKCHDYLLIEGCSDPSLPSSIEISRYYRRIPVNKILDNSGYVVPRNVGG
ncbi:Disease resistance protein RPP2B [Glycine max]|nr:Disease resistance protein RPP2B [Glycine max]